jgi:hypothetical protein
MVCEHIQGETKNKNQAMNKPPHANHLTTCTATSREIRYAYAPGYPLPHAPVPASTVHTTVKVTIRTSDPPTPETDLQALRAAIRALDLLN